MNPEQHEPQLAFNLSPWQSLLIAGCGFVCLSLAALGWLAYAAEGVTLGFYSAFFWLGMATLAGYWLLYLPRMVAYSNHQLALVWWWKRETVAIDEISSIGRRRYWIVLATATQQYRLHFLIPNNSAEMLSWLEEHVPAAAAARAREREQPLPLILAPRLTAPAISFGIVLLFGITGGALLWTAWQGWQRGDGTTGIIGMALFALITLLLAALFCYMLIDSYVWRIVFDEEHITLRRTLQTEQYPANQVIDTTLITEERTVKGFVHQIYKLRLSFEDGTEVDIAPNLPSFPMDYAGAEESRLLTMVQTVLEAHYRPVIRLELDPTTVTDSRWGTPTLAIQWQIRPYDLTVTRLDYGEHHAAASTIHLLVGHSEAGAMRFRTTNGQSHISADGRFIVLFDETLLIVFNLANGRTYHRSSRRGWLYAQIELIEEALVIEEMRRIDSQQREVRKPISLAKPTSALRRGFGPAEDGDFPSAYG